ncbi:MAG: hypothetical protein H6818_07710 [Phycisphaerales bacterium]|nr:hypothetical protein [Phycisphaerales bacterium]MCB9864211.1 hypothetical protein [Phycisphaerales bacterium]
MSVLRQFRRRCTSAVVHGAATLAPLAPGFAVNFAETLIGRLGPMAPRLASIVRGNMIAANVYSPEVFRQHFRNVARHLTNGLRVLSSRSPDAVRSIASRDVRVDDSVEVAKAEIERHRGGLIAPAHCVNYLVSLVQLNQSLPVSMYLRWSKDARKVELKKRWCDAAGFDVIIEPPRLTNPAARAELIVEAIRAGKTVAITPDLAQRAGEGVAVRWLDRIAYLPSGPASLAMLAEVPMLPLFARREGDRQTLYFASPIHVTRLSRAEGGRTESVRRAMQCWADGFQTFVQNSPDQWFLWGDSRWTRVLRGDPVYSGVVEPLMKPETAEAQQT